jgi:hypothetical protein
LTFWASAISTSQPFLLERVVDEPGAGHRLDDRSDVLAVNPVDSPRKGSERVDVRRDGELVDVLPLLGEQADVEPAPTEIQSSVQHVKRGLLGAPRLVTTTEPVTNGGPSSWQSKAIARRTETREV